jgi:outer membrane protein OmpA-like peptidoglycan-associated protein
MKRRRRSNGSDDSTNWIGYTDLLGNSLLILLLTVAVSALARGLNEKPPLLALTEAESFRFDTGSYKLSDQFKAALQARLPEIRKTIDKYRIDTVEIIGHTDGRPSSGTSNLDFRLPSAGISAELNGYDPGSNIDLGLLRAMSVANYLRNLLEQEDQSFMIRPYSAGSLIDTAGNYAPADNRDRAERRRIEVRFTRREER